MPAKTTQPDIVQRIAEHLARTSEPRISVHAGIPNDPNQERIGTVPMHLRHLHNLLEELSVEAAIAAREHHGRVELMNAVRTVFFSALETYVPNPEGASGIEITKDWNVVANMGKSEESNLIDMLDTLLAGGRRR